VLASNRAYDAYNFEMASRFGENLCIPDLMLKEVKPNFHNSESLSSGLFSRVGKIAKSDY
jgi:hypothetical protein